MKEWIIEAEHLQKNFAWAPVLKDISCRIGASEIVGVFGPTGAGKTTLLRLFATLLRPNSGTLNLFGSTSSGPKLRERIGFFGHDTLLYPDLSAEENLAFYGRVYRVGNLKSKINDLLGEAGLEKWRATPVRQFSMGMERRLSLARLALHSPDLLLLDEPYSGLDVRAVSALHLRLEEAKEMGKTVIFSSHDFVQTRHLCSRIMILHRGHIVWQASPPFPSPGEFVDIYVAHTL